MKYTTYVLIAVFLIFTNQAHAESEYQLPEPKLLTLDESISEQQAETMMLTARTYAAFWDTGKEVFAKQALAGDFIDLNLPEGRKQGTQGPLDASRWFRGVVPDLRCEIEEMIIVQDKVILRLHFTGHFTGTFNDVNGEGQEISFSAVDMYTIENGKIKTNWHLEDNQTLMQQLTQ